MSSSTAQVAKPPAAAPDTKKKAWRIMDPVRGQIRLALCLSCLSCFCTLLTLFALAWVVYALQYGGVALWQPVTLAFAGTAGAYVLRRLSFDQSHFAAFRLETLLRTQLTTHTAQLSLGQVQTLGTGALSKVVYDDVKELHVYVADSTPLYARAYFLPVVTFLLLLWLDWRLALAALAVLLIGMGILSSVMRDRADIMRKYTQEREKVNAAIIEFVQAMPVVRNFDSGQATFGRYQNALQGYKAMLDQWWRQVGTLAKLSMALLNPMPTLAVLLWLGAWLMWGQADTEGSLAFSTWVAVLLLGTGMAEALIPLHSLGHMLDRAKLSAGRIHDILDIPPLPQVPSENARMPQSADVVFENVSFRYTDNDAPALQNVTFHARPGTTTALVGPSGAGKTTVARLIPRFWDVSEGRILVGGIDIRELPLDVLMAQIACVFQDTFLFATSIAENIRLGLADATLEQVQDAARAAQAHEFISQLPQGYDTNAGERGIFLSGGQRQRITIARAILQNRPILILDEATAFADPENEEALVKALAALMRGKTVLMVAHRLTTIRDADQILVFNQGRLAEQGQHDALVANAGIYARLWNNYQQAQGWALRHNAVPLQGITAQEQHA